ncbi:MAG: hypothetical protein R6W91_04295 [Thermoplasmata archaeon]
MRPRVRDSAGQAAMVDAILFMTVMLVASAVVIGSTTLPGTGLSVVQQYTADYAQTLLSVELTGLEYRDAGGNAVILNGSGRSIGQLLCDEALILGAGIGRSDFSDYDAKILAAGKSIIRPDMDFAISCNGGAVFISGCTSSVSGLPGTHSASQMTIWDGSASLAPITITVYVWVA